MLDSILSSLNRLNYLLRQKCGILSTNVMDFFYPKGAIERLERVRKNSPGIMVILEAVEIVDSSSPNEIPIKQYVNSIGKFGTSCEYIVKHRHLIDAIDIYKYPTTSVWLMSNAHTNLFSEYQLSMFKRFVEIDHKWQEGSFVWLDKNLTDLPVEPKEGPHHLQIYEFRKLINELLVIIALTEEV